MKGFKRIQKELAEKRKAIERMVTADESADVLLAAFEGRIGSQPSAAELGQFHSDAAARFAVKFPPGYKDLGPKGVPDAYGDYIAWRQLISIAAGEKKDFILVTDDVKEDWWQIEGERRIGPRPELLEEFCRETSQRIWLYTSEGFLIAAKDYDSSRVKDEVIKEVGARLVAQTALIATATKIIAGPSAEEEDEVYFDAQKSASSPTKFSAPKKALQPEANGKLKGNESEEEAG